MRVPNTLSTFGAQWKARNVSHLGSIDHTISLLPCKFLLILPLCNVAAMNLHLAEIAAQVAPGAHAMLLVDMSGRLVAPPNITLVPLPPKCPELNPENIWEFMCDNSLSNRIFKSYDDIVDHCCHAWNKLIDQPWRIMSIGMREWAHGS